jgi:8-oxo-dGTP pyrophosphatase MutT (NUDIX family)
MANMRVRNRQAALCILRRSHTFLVAQITDPHTGRIYHRPPGGGLEANESPEAAVTREIQEELGITLTDFQPLGPIDHIWLWKGYEVHERAWLFLSDSSKYPNLSNGQTPEILEADGDRFITHWRSIRETDQFRPPICPSTLLDFLRPHLT